VIARWSCGRLLQLVIVFRETEATLHQRENERYIRRERQQPTPASLAACFGPRSDGWCWPDGPVRLIWDGAVMDWCRGVDVDQNWSARRRQHDTQYYLHTHTRRWAMMFVWRQEMRLPELFCVVLCTEAVHSYKHTYGRLTVLTVRWIGFCLAGPISLCIDSFVFMCLYLVCSCFTLHSCCIIVSTVGWTWWDWSLIFWTYLPSVLLPLLVGSFDP